MSMDYEDWVRLTFPDRNYKNVMEQLMPEAGKINPEDIVRYEPRITARLQLVVDNLPSFAVAAWDKEFPKKRREYVL